MHLNLDHYRLDADCKHGLYLTALPTAWVADSVGAVVEIGMSNGRLTGGVFFSRLSSLNTPQSAPVKPDIHSEQFLHLLMRRQLKLSIACALSFLLVLLGLPLANYFLPELMATRVGGFTLTWFLLGIGFFPAVWGISFYFIRRSIALENQEVAEVQGADTLKS